MRVLHCIPSSEGGGAERQLTYLARALVLGGCDIHVALTREGSNFDRLRATGATIHQLGPCHNHDPRLFTRLIQTIFQVKPDLVQCWLPQMELLGGVASLATGTPWLFSERSSALAYRGTLKNRLRTNIASLSSGIVSNSAGGDQYWSTRASTSVPRYVVRNGLPLEEIAATPQVPIDDASPDGNGPLVLLAGRFDHGKNAIALVKALRLVAVTTSFRARLYGEGPLRGAVEDLIAVYGLASRVRVVSFTSNLWGLLKGAKVLVAPSRFEGSPNVVLEAMACHCPLVVSDIVAHREILDDTSAIFVDPEDTLAMARAIQRVLWDPVGAGLRADAARTRSDLHTLADVAQQYLRVYHDVLTRRVTARGWMVR